MSTSPPPPPPPPASGPPPPPPAASVPTAATRGSSCWLWGCLLCVGLLVLMVGGCAATGAYYVNTLKKNFTGDAPVALPLNEASEDEQGAVEERLKAFTDKVEVGETATLELTAELVPLTRTPGVVSLHRGWNLVGSGGGGSIATVTDPLGGIFTSVFAWDAVGATFRSFNPQFPFLTTLQVVTAGAGLWMFVDDPEGTLWLQPPIQDAREVSLETGFNLVMWTGPETDVAQAVASIGGALRAMFIWDPLGQAFLSFNPALPSQLNTASTLRYGDGVWIQTSAPAMWSQPAP